MDGQKTKAEQLRVGGRAMLPDGYTGIVTDNNPVLGMTTLVRLGEGVDYSSAPSQGGIVAVATNKLTAITNPADVLFTHPHSKLPRFLVTNVGPTTIVVPITISAPRAIYLNRDEIVSLEAMSRPLALLRLSGREDVQDRAEKIGYRDVKIEVKGTTLHFEGWKGGDRHRTEVGMGTCMSSAEALSLLWHRVNALPNAIQQPHESVAALELKEARACLKTAQDEDREARSILNRMGAPKGTLAQKIQSVSLSEEGKLKPLYDTLAELEEWDPSRAQETVIEAACRVLREYRAASLSDELEKIDKVLDEIGESSEDETIAEAACRALRRPRAEVDTIMLDAIKAAKDYQKAFDACSSSNLEAGMALKGHRQALWDKLNLITTLSNSAMAVGPTQMRRLLDAVKAAKEYQATFQSEAHEDDLIPLRDVLWEKLDLVSIEAPVPEPVDKPGDPDEPDEIWCWPDKCNGDRRPNNASWSQGYGLWSVTKPEQEGSRHRYYREGIVEAWKKRHRDVLYQRDHLKAKLEGIDLARGANEGTSAIKAPQSVLANGGCVKLPTFVVQHIGAEDGDGVVFWAHDTIDHAMVIVSNKTAIKKLGWDSSPLSEQFPYGTLLRFTTPQGSETGIVVNYEVERGRDLLRLRLPGNRLGIVNPSIVHVQKMERCPHFYGRHGLQCELEARHACDHWASVDDQQAEEWERDLDAEHDANRLWTSVYAQMLPIVAKESPDLAHDQARAWANRAVREFYNRPE